MARKRQEIALQATIETQEEWEENLGKEGLTVCDVYQEWCGPCKAMVSKFKTIKNEIGDDLLHFAIAKADTVDSLERYRGKCEPCFLFYAGGSLVSVIRGCNVPVISRTIIEQLATEHKVIDGEVERKEIKDPLLPEIEEKKEDDEEETDDEEDIFKIGILNKPKSEPQKTVVNLQEAVDTAEYEEGEEGISHKGERVIFESLPELADEIQPEEVKKSVTVAIIKPNVVEEGKVDEVIEQMKEKGLEILEQTEKTLTEEEAREFYDHKKDEEYFEDLVKFMTSGPSHVLVLTKGETGDHVIEDWRELLGPASVEEAQEQAPESLRAKYGKETYINALHGSDSEETATRELGFFFPNFVVPTVQSEGAKVKVQRTLALIRPDALKDKKDDILGKIEEAGFKVAMQKEINLSKEQAEAFYKEHKDEAYFEELTNRMTSGPLLALALAREDAVTGWRDLLGPKEVDKAKEEAPDSLRAQFSVEDVPINQLHGSDSTETAQSELQYFFPVEQTVAVVKPDAYQTKDEIMKKVREAGFHIAARKETELTKEMAEQLYSSNKDSEYYGDLVEHMTSGKTLFMILSRQDAVDGWRSIMGPTDPTNAKETAPETLRANYGTDVKSNGLHGSSNQEHAVAEMKILFGDVEFNEDGTVKNKDDVIAQSARGDEEEKDGEEGEGEQTEQQAEGEGETQPAKGEGQTEEAEGQQAESEEGQQAEGEEGQTAEGEEGQQAEGEEGQTAEGEEGQQTEGEEGQTAEGEEGQQAEGEDGQQAEEGQTAEGEGQQAEGEEGQTAEGDGQTAEGEGQATEGDGEAAPAEEGQEPDTGSIRSGSAQGSIKDEEPSRPPSTMSQKRSDSKASLHSAAEKKSSPAGSGASLHSNSGVKSNEQRPKSAKSTHSKSDSRAASSTSHHSEKVERSASQSSIKSDGHADDPKESEKRGSISSQTSVKSAGSGKSRSTSRASKNSSKVSVKPDDASVKQGSHGSVRSNTSPREAKASHAGSAASVKPPSRAGTPGSARSNASQHGDGTDDNQDNEAANSRQGSPAPSQTNQSQTSRQASPAPSQANQSQASRQVSPAPSGKINQSQASLKSDKKSLKSVTGSKTSLKSNTSGASKASATSEKSKPSQSGSRVASAASLKSKTSTTSKSSDKKKVSAPSSKGAGKPPPAPSKSKKGAKGAKPAPTKTSSPEPEPEPAPESAPEPAPEPESAENAEQTADNTETSEEKPADQTEETEQAPAEEQKEGEATEQAAEEETPAGDEQAPASEEQADAPAEQASEEATEQATEEASEQAAEEQQAEAAPAEEQTQEGEEEQKAGEEQTAEE